MLLYKNYLSVSTYIPLLSAENKLFEFISVDVSAKKNCLRFTCFYIPSSTVVSYNDFYCACKCLRDSMLLVLLTLFVVILTCPILTGVFPLV